MTSNLQRSIINTPGRIASAFACVCLLAPCGGALAQIGAGLTPTAGIELEELQIALEASQAQIGRLEARVIQLEEKNKNLSEALVAANIEGELSRESYRTLRSRVEALGMAAIDPDPASLQTQYIQVLSDYRLTREENDRLSDAISKLGAAITAYLKTAISAGEDERFAVEVAVREASGLVAGVAQPRGEAVTVPLQQAKVISLKSDYDLAVLNVGRKSGVQVGMPFRIARKDRPIGKALVIDVRDNICGVVMQELVAGNDQVQLGDSASVDPTRQGTL